MKSFQRLRKISGLEGNEYEKINSKACQGKFILKNLILTFYFKKLSCDEDFYFLSLNNFFAFKIIPLLELVNGNIILL